MIHNILPVIVSELNEYLKSRYNTSEDCVVLSNIMNLDGTVAVKEMNRMVCTLINVREDRTLKASKGFRGGESGFYLSGGDLQISLDIGFFAVYKNSLYVDAMKFLSGTLYFFNEKSVFTNANTPGLSTNVDRLTFELRTLDTNELQSIVSLMGLRHLPFVVYNMRLLSFNAENVEDTVPALGGITVDPESD